MKYKHFDSQEAAGVEQDVMLMLDKARDAAGIPFYITCKGRTFQKNKEVGGEPDSAHLDLADPDGLSPAVDLACDNSSDRYKMVFALHDAGFNRIIIEPHCIHVDNDPTKPKEILAIWSRK